MKKLLLTAALLLLSAIPAFAKPAAPSFSDTLSKSTLAVYVGMEECGYKTVDTFFGAMDVWGCEFKSHFTCTGTVIEADGRGNYAGLTAGHCFSYRMMDKGYKYYVADTLSEHPVLHEIHLVKFTNEPRYDYAVFSFQSLKEYAAIEIQKSGAAPAVGTEVVNVNFSLGVVKQITEGKVLSTQITGQEGENPCSNCRSRYFVNIGIGPGASGSAVVDKKTHKIVGLVESVFPSTQMATIIVPMGDTFVDFLDDASAGIRPPAAKGPEVRWHPEPPAPKAAPLSFWELVKQLIRKLEFWK